jgi:hypothetical protein
MRVNITYTDYKNNKLYNQVIKYNLNNENKPNEHLFNDVTNRNCVNINKSYCVCDEVTEYNDINGNINYRIDIQPQFRRRKSKKTSEIDKLVNTMCDTLYINVLTEVGSSRNDTMTIMVDESKVIIDESIPIPDVGISVNIYDNIGIFDMIKLYQINKI